MKRMCTNISSRAPAPPPPLTAVVEESPALYLQFDGVAMGLLCVIVGVWHRAGAANIITVIVVGGRLFLVICFILT